MRAIISFGAGDTVTIQIMPEDDLERPLLHALSGHSALASLQALYEDVTATYDATGREYELDSPAHCSSLIITLAKSELGDTRSPSGGSIAQNIADAIQIIFRANSR
jgi:hypothetical protein